MPLPIVLQNRKLTANHMAELNHLRIALTPGQNLEFFGRVQKADWMDLELGVAPDSELGSQSFEQKIVNSHFVDLDDNVVLGVDRCAVE